MFKKLTNRFRSQAAPMLLVLGLSFALGIAALMPTPASATMQISTATRTNLGTALLADIAGGTAEFWSGSRPANLGTPTGTLLATVTLSNPAGTVTSGVVTIGSISQTASSHVTGTPTFVRFKSSGGVIRWDIDIGAGAGNIPFTGTITTNQNVTFTSVTFTMPNA